MTPPKELLQIAVERDIPVFMSRVKTTKFSLQAIMYLNRVLAPHVTRHGVLVDVYGVGVLLTGESGVGKSEAALELVKRGHQLAADDVVDICRVSDDRLVGEAPEMVRHFMEIRGIGIIDIRAMYGVGSVILSKSIDTGHPHGKVGFLQGIRPSGPDGRNGQHSGRKGALSGHARQAGPESGHHY